MAIQEDWHGLVHGTCQGQCTWFEFAKAIFEVKGIQADLTPCITADYPTPAKRPAFSVLDGSCRSQKGTDVMPDWLVALKEIAKS